jgi:HTH-type transcriptional repressor of NAD biosynthesis genes
MPPHNGHLHMINKSMEMVDELTVLVCSVKREKIAGHLRFEWMKQLVPNAHVIHVTDEVPSYPNEHPEFWTIWTKLLKNYLGEGIEIIFSSEEYGQEVADRLGIEHLMIDRDRKVVPVSGTWIRNDPFKFWEFIPELIRPYFVKKIAIVGPESTGKTTLAEALADYFKTSWVKEYGREYFVGLKRPLNIKDIEIIAEGQLALEEKGLKNANKLLFCDTELFVTKIWSEIYFGKCPEWIIEKALEKRYDLYLLMGIDIPWVDDGTREFPQLRSFHFELIKNELEDRHLSFVYISGDFKSRIAMAISEIEDKLYLR